MTDVHDALDRAEREVFTRQPPQSVKARVNLLLGKLKTTRAVAEAIEVSQRSVLPPPRPAAALPAIQLRPRRPPRSR